MYSTPKKHILVRSLFILMGIVYLSSCGEPEIPEIEFTPADLNSVRSERSLFEAADADLKSTHDRLLADAPEFYSIYYSEVLRLGDPRGDSVTTGLKAFRDYELCRLAYSHIIEEFGSKDFADDLAAPFGRYAAMFPNERLPMIVTMNSGFNYGIFPMDSTLAIGLEFYLGAQDTLIATLPGEQFPQYMRDKMEPSRIVPNAMRGWLLSRTEEYRTGKDLLDEIVYQGKVHYLLHRCMPDVPLHLQLGYTGAETQWCLDHEFDIWKAIVSEDMLFATDRETLRNWLGNGPFSKGFGESSPAPLAPFVGRQMVVDYMREHPEVTDRQLLSVSSRDILKDYTPR